MSSITTAVIRSIFDSDFVECVSIRLRVFIQEQKFPLTGELDEHDGPGVHFLARIDGVPVGAARVYVIEDGGKRVGKIGRLACLPSARGRGVGKSLLESAVQELLRQSVDVVCLSSQMDKVNFYEKRGFKAKGDVYLEEGVPHVLMYYNR